MVRDPEKAYDMDIGISGNEKVSFELIEDIKDDLDESIVPYRHNITDFYNADKEFRKFALSNIQIWNESDLVEIK